MSNYEWRHYVSEDDSEWLILSLKNDKETDSEIYSKNNKISTMKIHRNAGDYISASILSASEEFDSITGKLGLENDFYVKLECLKNGWSSISYKTYKKDEALNIIKLFIGLRSNTAIKIWNMKRLGGDNSGNRIELD